MNVGEVAAAAGVSVRTLHHWDEIGLLVPSARSTNGYRSYDAADLVRLRQVLTYRELGFRLDEVKAILDDPDVDEVEHLRRQQALLAERIERLQDVAALVQRALEARTVGAGTDPAELRDVFGEEAQSRWGDTDAWAQSQARTSSYGEQDWQRIRQEGAAVERRLADAMAAGEPADGAVARALAEEHRLHISRSFYDCDVEMQRALADLYVTDDRFRAHYEAVAPGLAEYLHDAICANAAGAVP